MSTSIINAETRYLSTDYVAIYKSWKSFKKGKRSCLAIDKFAYLLETNLMKLSLELGNRSYVHSSYQPVVLYEKKRRDLAVATVRDRIVHRLLYEHLVAIYDKSFDPDVWSCRKGKGLHACLARTQKLLQKYPKGYIWRADITKFYDNVNHSILMDCLSRKFNQDSNVLFLLNKVINTYSTINSHSGIPIGNLTSQIFSNVYLHEFDRYVRHFIKPLAYIRYGDDFLIFFPSRMSAYKAREVATSFLLDSLSLTINPQNDILILSQYGLKFLGHNITKCYTVVDRHTTSNVLNKLNWRNASSYKALLLSKTEKERLDWILLEKYVDV